MVDSTSDMPTSKIKTQVYVDEVELDKDSFVAFYFSNALTLMKLRERGATKLSELLKGVF